jgi:hypothetical protein
MNAPSRRAMLAGTDAVIAAVGIPTAAVALAANPDAELIAACEQHPINTRAFNRYPEEGAETERLWAAYEATRDLISDAVPLTMAGVLAKARAAAGEARGLYGQEQWGGSMGEGWAYDIVKDLLRLSGNPVSFAPDPEEDGEVEVLDQPHPDNDLLLAAEAFVKADTEEAATLWADDDCDRRQEGRGAARDRLEAARATQERTGRVLVEAQATTLAGYGAKAMAARVWYGDTPPNDGLGAEFLWSLAEDLELANGTST